MKVNHLLGQRLALVAAWSEPSGEEQRAVFLGILTATPAGLALSDHGEELLLPSDWAARIRPATDTEQKLVDNAPFLLRYELKQAPAGFAPAELVSRGF